MVRRKLCVCISLALVCLAHGPVLLAQPSGGPYGPIQLTYDIPEDAAGVYYAAPDGDASANGASPDSPTTVESAVNKAVTGDAVILRGGIYRTGDLEFNQGITLQPYRNEQPVFKGTRIAADWEQLPGSIWRTNWETLFPLPPQPWWMKQNHLRSTPEYMFNNDMVFVDGQPLAVKGYPAELDENSFCVDYAEGYVYIGADPVGRTVEITAYDNALTRTTQKVNGKASDRIGPVIQGIKFTQYAYRAIEIEGYDPEKVSPEEEHGKDVVGTRIEHCALSHCSRVGAYLRGDNMVIRHNLISDTGTEGLFILASNDVLLEKNVVTRNNVAGIMGYFSTAVKIFNQCRRVTCSDNLIIDNHGDSFGIWYDVGNVDGIFINNWIEKTDNGFFFEISKGVICAGNVFVNCNTGSQVLNSSAAKLFQNTYINSRATFIRNDRGSGEDHFGWHPQSGPGVDERYGHAFGNNLIVVDPAFDMTLLHVRQDPVLSGKLTEPMFDYADCNVYVRGEASSPLETLDGSGSGRSPAATLISWAPLETDGEDCNRSFETLEAFQALELGFETGSISLIDYNGPLFQGKRLGNYSIIGSFAERVKPAPLPDDIREVLPDVYGERRFPGALPPVGP